MYKVWSEEEIKLLKKHYSTTSKHDLLNILPNRTASSIQHKAVRLGLSKKIRWWTDEELLILKENWGSKTKPELMELLPNKRWTSIRHKAFELGLKKKRHRTRYWHTYRKSPDIILTDRQIGYFAGIIDGEGMITIKRSKQKGKVYYAPFVGITNTNLALIQKCMDIFKSGRFHVKRRAKPNHKTIYVYDIASVKGVKQILTQIIDELTVKKPQTEAVLEFIRVKEEKASYGVDPREEELFEEVRHLNARGNRNL